ncbi:hypothetical protein DL93DRAFT_1699899 [Clavulina sp. PMI_390]|nr:hypothetical protein DL93DRAFT_1699899 [Clavulina sp. PMI_390]
MLSEADAVAFAEKTLRPVLNKSEIFNKQGLGPEFFARLPLAAIWKLIHGFIHDSPTPRPFVSLANVGLVDCLFDILINTSESAKFRTSPTSVFCKAIGALLDIINIGFYPDRTPDRYLSEDIEWYWNGYQLRLVSALRASCLFRPIRDDALRLQLSSFRLQALQIIQAIREIPSISRDTALLQSIISAIYDLRSTLLSEPRTGSSILGTNGMFAVSSSQLFRSCAAYKRPIRPLHQKRKIARVL